MLNTFLASVFLPNPTDVFRFTPKKMMKSSPQEKFGSNGRGGMKINAWIRHFHFASRIAPSLGAKAEDVSVPQTAKKALQEFSIRENCIQIRWH